MILSYSIASKAQNNFSVAQPASCSELFFSEILFSKIPNGNNLDINYAIEIFNPTSTSINLSNYSLKLINNGGGFSSLALTGNLPAHACHVVTNSSCGAPLAALADALSSTVDLGINIELDLIKNGVIVDKIGEGTSTVGSNTPFDYALFIADPYAYLATIDINLDDFVNIDIRRGHFVNAGEPNFTSQKLLGKWTYALNTDLSDIGKHHSVCFSDGKPNVYLQFNDKGDEFCDTDTPDGPICCYANDALLVVLDMNGNPWPSDFHLRVELNPNQKLGGVNNIMLDDLDPNCGLYWGNTFLGTFNNVITPGTLTQPEEVVWKGEPVLYSASFANGSPHMLNGLFSKPNALLPVTDFPYEYHFEFNINSGNNSVTGDKFSQVSIVPAPSNTLTTVPPIQIVIGSQTTHVTRVNKGIACNYPANIKNLSQSDFKINKIVNSYSINGINKKFTYKLLDINGKLILENSSNENNFSIDNFSSGIYILSINCNGQFINYKLIR
jgi:hypothetical protein